MALARERVIREIRVWMSRTPGRFRVRKLTVVCAGKDCLGGKTDCDASRFRSGAFSVWALIMKHGAASVFLPIRPGSADIGIGAWRSLHRYVAGGPASQERALPLRAGLSSWRDRTAECTFSVYEKLNRPMKTGTNHAYEIPLSFPSPVPRCFSRLPLVSIRSSQRAEEQSLL